GAAAAFVPLAGRDESRHGTLKRAPHRTHNSCPPILLLLKRRFCSRIAFQPDPSSLSPAHDRVGVVTRMSQPISTPVVPPQPNLPYYGVAELALFKIYTRETYRAAFGIEAPSFDPSRVIKTWFDTTADTSQPDNIS